MSRIQLKREPFIDFSIIEQGKPLGWGWPQFGDWPASWVDHPVRPLDAPSVALFRLGFTAEKAATVRLHVSADNRYRLYLDGQPVGTGPERGDPQHWRYESYEIELTAGEHTLVAQNWWLADQAPFAQMSVRSGFLLAAEGEWQETLSTGIAPWEATLMEGFGFESPGVAWGTGAKVRIDGAAYPWGWENGDIGEWQPVVTLVPGMSAVWKNEIPPYWLLTPATLPPMLADEQQVGTLRYLADGENPYPVNASRQIIGETGAWQAWLAGQGTVTIPPHTTRTVVIDLENYFCAYPNLQVSGGAGAEVRLNWAEGLFEQPEGKTKGNRDEIEGKYFLGVGDTFLPDGGNQRTFSTLWWEAGRYLELTVITAEAPLTLDSLTLTETHYPLEMEGEFHSEDERLEEVIPIGVRALQMCSHETYMDCPYYEQLMYIGDTRLEVLTTYAITADDRLPRKALTSFDASRRLSGLTQSRFPSRVCQIIPPFSLWWVCMVHDYWLWRDDPAFVQELMPGVRAVNEYYRTLLGPDSVLNAPNGWNFTDWVKDPLWDAGVPADGEFGLSSIFNLQYALTLTYKAELEEFFGEQEMAARDRRTAAEVVNAVLRYFWDEERGLIADDRSFTRFSEHAQCLAILTGLLPEEALMSVADGLLDDPDLARTTIYFSYYLFETLYLLGRGDRILEEMELWYDLKSQGFKTTFEEPEPTRSDCHAWGAHPIHHYYASLLGIRPDGPGFRRVRIDPQLGTLAWAKGTLPHPAGQVQVSLQQEGDRLRGQVLLPPGVTGIVQWNGLEEELQPGGNSFLL
ncbi:MAG: alpha-L-rhamnosidase-related protein [Armatimonadota bacterium]